MQSHDLENRGGGGADKIHDLGMNLTGRKPHQHLVQKIWYFEYFNISEYFWIFLNILNILILVNISEYLICDWVRSYTASYQTTELRENVRYCQWVKSHPVVTHIVSDTHTPTHTHQHTPTNTHPLTERDTHTDPDTHTPTHTHTQTQRHTHTHHTGEH